MQHRFAPLARTLVLSLTLTMGLAASAQEATIRKNLSERLPKLPKIDEISKTPMAGLYEVRVNGTDVLYTDAEGNYLIQGSLIDTRAMRNLTDERTEKLLAVPFDSLPFKDAFTIVRGNGSRKLAIFEDPNCGYCKRFERELQKVNNITIHLFLYPILGPDSTEKSKTIWCAKDRAKVWTDYMVADKPLPSGNGCDTNALARNIEFGRKHRINGTPALIYADGTRVPGAAEAAQVEKQLAESQPNIKN